MVTKMISTDGRLILNVRKDREWNEWQVTYCLDGKYFPERKYHTDDRTDATGTMKSIMKHYEEYGV